MKRKISNAEPVDLDAEPVDLDALLWGAEAIGKQINRNARQAYHLLEKGRLPAKKIGKLWTSTPRRLRAHILGEVA